MIHLDSIRSLEEQLKPPTTTPATCTRADDHADRAQLQHRRQLPDHVKFMSDLVAAAVICGKSRAVTMDLIDNGGGNSLTFPWLNIPSPDFHAIAHQGSANYAQKTVIDAVVLSGVRRRRSSASSPPPPRAAARVLDNTVILVTNDMSEGAAHFVGQIPYVDHRQRRRLLQDRAHGDVPEPDPEQPPADVRAARAGHDLVTGVGDPKYAGNIDTALTT